MFEDRDDGVEVVVQWEADHFVADVLVVSLVAAGEPVAARFGVAVVAHHI